MIIPTRTLSNVDKREFARHYIPACDSDVEAMLEFIGLDKLEDLFSHIPGDVRFAQAPELPEELDAEAVREKISGIAGRNRIAESYVGDGLMAYTVSPIVDEVCKIRNLATAYTPYQPERSQGTLLTHWIYQCLMAQVTGFEAVNASLYDRSTAIFEAICASIRMSRKADTAIVPEAIYPGDMEVLDTLVQDTAIRIIKTPLDADTGRIDMAALRVAVAEAGDSLAAIVFPQVNCLGLLEDVDDLTDMAVACGAKSVAVIDPALLATGGLKAPTQFGGKGADMIVGEAQHLALGPNFGGPGLGLFGIRYNEENRNGIRSTPGRFVGKGVDAAGRDCRVAVLSTREQHIRKEKATSNICSNQAFIATLVGAALLARGESGTAKAVALSRIHALRAWETLGRYKGVRIAYPDGPFFNEMTLELDAGVAEVIELARRDGIHLGVDVSGRVGGGRNLLKMSFTDKPVDVDGLQAFMDRHFEVGRSRSEGGARPAMLSRSYLRLDAVGLPEFGGEEVLAYYRKLGELNVSPDDACYPLGSCTMKYNPVLNEWAAGLEGFTGVHPQAPVEDVQGSLEVLYETQEWFRRITGLAGVTTQPVAGAQGELVGIKLFQAYHRDRGEKRDVILVPKSSHGTNFATAAMAGFSGRDGIVTLSADEAGRVCLEDLDAKIAQYGKRICGVMVTNPNTSGIFETHFKAVAERVHAVGGLVYMDGANMNAIAGWVDLGALGVDAVHNNLHKTWTIPHGGGGPGDAIVAVSEKLVDYLPGYQVVREDGLFKPVRAPKSIGSFHRHWGNFAHKVRAYTYLLRLGRDGVRRMSAMAVLSARYLHTRLSASYPGLPAATSEPRMHEFILTLDEADFARIEGAGVARAQAIPSVGKMFLDFGFHAPTVAWPEAFGLMIEPTESYTKAELDRFAEAVEAIGEVIREQPGLLKTAPHFTPIDRVDEVAANRNPVVSERLERLPEVVPNRISPATLAAMPVSAIKAKLLGREAGMQLAG